MEVPIVHFSDIPKYAFGQRMNSATTPLFENKNQCQWNQSRDETFYAANDLKYGTWCAPCSDVVQLRSSILPNLVFDLSFFLAAKKYPGSVTTSQRSPTTAALLQRRTLIGYLDLCFTVADPKRDFRACSYLCVGLLDRPLLCSHLGQAFHRSSQCGSLEPCKMLG